MNVRADGGVSLLRILGSKGHADITKLLQKHGAKE